MTIIDVSGITNGSNVLVKPLYLSEAFVNAFEETFFVFWCITVPLYVFLLFTLIRAQYKKVMDIATPFYQIFIASSIIDLITLLNNYFGAVFPKWGWWPSIYYTMGQAYLKIYFYIAWATGICQALSVSIMATNRLYAMMYPENHAKFWCGLRLKATISAQFLVGMLGSLPNFATEVEIVPGDNGRGIIPKISNKSTSKMYFTLGGGFLAINCLYLIFAYIYLYSMLRKRHQHQLETSTRTRIERIKLRAKKREHRLFLMSSCVGCQSASCALIQPNNANIYVFHESEID